MPTTQRPVRSEARTGKGPGYGSARTDSEDDVKRAAERVTLACRALSTAANDLRIAHRRSGTMALEDAADQVNAETERVCELAEELVKLGRNLTNAAARAARAELAGAPQGRRDPSLRASPIPR